jgi:hypothetical protein
LLIRFCLVTFKFFFHIASFTVISNERPNLHKETSIKRQNLMWIFVCFALSFFTVEVGATPLPDTGVTKCYDSSKMIACPSPGQDFYGQDANYTINPPSYTKLDGSGVALPDSATSWVMVKDNVTGLIWEIKTKKDGVKNYEDPNDADNNYTWYDSNPATNGGDPGTIGNDTEVFLKALNDAKYGSFSDWRLPTIKELESIINYSIVSPRPTIDAGYFPNTQSSLYWSSTTYAENAWSVDFADGDIYGYGYSKYGSYYVRAVRGGQPGSLAHLVISPTSQYVSKDMGTTTFSVSNTGTGTMHWTAAVTSGGTWLSITSGASGTDTGTITCSFTANTSLSSRTATIRVTAPYATGNPVDVTVTQTLAPTPTLLWSGSDGRASIWTMDMDADKTSEMFYGPYPGWTPKSYHKNSDGTANMLWGHADGYVSLWMMNASGDPTSMSYYGPYADWNARCYHRNSDGTANMLWGRTDGYVALWMMDASGNKTSEMLYGPYEGWTAKSYHGYNDGTANMLWGRTDGYVSLWTMDASGNPTSMSYYGPYPDWTVKSYHRNSDGTANMLWGRIDGYVSLWTMNASGNKTSEMPYGPYEGWTAQDYD